MALTTNDMQRLEARWEKKHEVSVMHLKNQNKNIHITQDGLFQGPEQLLVWSEVQDLEVAPSCVVISVNRPWFFGLIGTQNITINCTELESSSDEVVELIRLAYNHYIESSDAK